MSGNSTRPTLLIRGPADTLNKIRQRAAEEKMTYSAYVINRCLEGDTKGPRARLTDHEALQKIEGLAFELSVASKELRPLVGPLQALAKAAAPGSSAADLEDSVGRCLRGVRTILRELWGLL